MAEGVRPFREVKRTMLPETEPLQAQVARLEAANAAKGMQLRAELARHVQDGHWGTVTEPKPETCGRCAAMVAALSDTGEGWLEVREQARLAMQKMAPQFAVLRQTMAGPWLDCMEREYLAALDKLGGK